MGTKNRVTIDKAGRLVIPKSYREAFHIHAGDCLELDILGDEMTLHPIREVAPMKKEGGFWVYRTGHPGNFSIPDLVDRDREQRIRQISG